MHRRIRFAAAAVLVSVATACAAASNAGPNKGSNPNVITADQFKGMEDQSAYTVIQRLHPNYLVAARGAVSIDAKADAQRGAGSASGVPVYLDGKMIGNIEDLKNIQAGRLFEIRYLTASDAAIKFGARSNIPVIALTSR